MASTQLRADPYLPEHELGSECGEWLSENDDFQPPIDKPS